MTDPTIDESLRLAVLWTTDSTLRRLLKFVKPYVDVRSVIIKVSLGIITMSIGNTWYIDT